MKSRAVDEMDGSSVRMLLFVALPSMCCPPERGGGRDAATPVGSSSLVSRGCTSSGHRVVSRTTSIGAKHCKIDETLGSEVGIKQSMVNRVLEYQERYLRELCGVRNQSNASLYNSGTSNSRPMNVLPR